MGTAVFNTIHGLVCESQNFSTRSNTSGQYPKVSIGILLDKTPSLQHEVRKKETVPSHAYREVSASQQNVSCGSGKKVNTEEKELGPYHRKEAVWVSTRPIHHRKTSVIRREERVQDFFDGFAYDANGAKSADLKEGERAHKESGGFAYGTNVAKTADLRESEEVAALAQDFHLLDKGKLSENANTVTKLHKESLRLKLWEILGSGLSPTKQMHNPQILKEGKSTTATEKKDDPQNIKETSCKQNSDTIETDSENISDTRRPITRSLRRKQAQQKSFPNFKQNGDPKKQASSSVCGFKGKNTNRNAFTFDEKAGTVDGFNRHGERTLSRLRTGKRSNRNISRIEPRRISFPDRSPSDKIPEITENEQPRSPIDVSAIENVIEVMHHSPDKTKVSALHQTNEYSTKKSQNSETGQKTSPFQEGNEMKVRTINHERTQSFADDGKKSKNLGYSSFSRSSQSPDILPSPTLNIASASAKEVPREQVRFDPVQNEKIFCTRKTPDSINSPSSMSGSSGSDADSKISNEKGYTKSPLRETPLTKEESSYKHLSQSQSSSDCGNSDRNEASNQGLGAMKWFADRGYKKIPISHSCSKKLRIIEDMGVRNITSSGTEETIHFVEVPEQPSEDGLVRAISQFALFLDQFKDKIRSYKRKKNSEILYAFGDRIHTQLQNVESQIQADVGRFTSLAKLKRKRLESTFQEQQEKLKVIHEKFKEEMKKHLDDCRGALEELETFQMELKTNAEQQRASHRKLLVQVEKVMKLQISDAEISIATIQEVTRRKMNGLKHALREWLNDGPLS